MAVCYDTKICLNALCKLDLYTDFHEVITLVITCAGRRPCRITGQTHAARFRKAPMTYVIALPCVDVKDRACVEECPVDCIYEGDRTLYIHPDECVDCGACEPVCPVEAIYYEDDVPEEWSEYITANAEFFDDLGSPGGAAKMEPTGKDVPFIAALPPQGE